MKPRKKRPLPSPEEAKKFRQQREKLGTQDEVALLIPCSQSALSHWEKARNPIPPMAWARMKTLLTENLTMGNFIANLVESYVQEFGTSYSPKNSSDSLWLETGFQEWKGKPIDWSEFEALFIAELERQEDIAELERQEEKV